MMSKYAKNPSIPCNSVIPLFYIIIDVHSSNTAETNESNLAASSSDSPFEEFEGIDQACMDEWMEAIAKYKADKELRRYDEFCMFNSQSFPVKSDATYRS